MVNVCILDYGFGNVKSVKNLNKYQIKNLFIQNMIKNNVLSIGTNNINYSLNKKDISQVKKSYSKTLEEIKDKSLSKKKLKIDEIKPIFSVRK